MVRKRILVHLFTWSCIVIFIIIGSVIGVQLYSPSIGGLGGVSMEESGRFIEERLNIPIEHLLHSENQKMTGELDTIDAEPVSEVKSIPVYVQSRPVYQKPTPVKPKLVLAKQLHPQLHFSGKQGGNKGESNVNPNLVTQTVYGFLDFTTTIGNTVMIFTPQTKKVDLVEPSVQVTTSVKESTSVNPTKLFMDEETTTTENILSLRQPKLIPMNDSVEIVSIPTILESSEYEPQVFATITTPTPIPTSTNLLELKYINLMSSSTESTSKTSSESFKVESLPPSESSVVVTSSSDDSKVLTEINFVTGDSNVPPTSKGFTLKLTKQPMTTTPGSLNKEVLPPAAPIHTVNPDEKTGLVNQIFETRIIDGVTTIHETKVLGTYIGSQYVRVLESSSTVLPVVIITASSHSPAPTIAPPPSTTPQTTTSPKPPTPPPTTSTTPKPPTKPPTTPTTPTSTTPKKYITLPKALPTPELPPEILTEQSVVSSSRNKEEFDEEDERFNEDLIGENEEHRHIEIASSAVLIEPTPTSSEEQTLYVLPQKEKTAQIYVSAIPSPDSYSRQPQLYVDISPAKSFDNIVTATPSRKQFRQQNSRNEYLNRFSNRFRTPSSTESNELTERPVQVQTPEPATNEEQTSTGKRPSSRFRSRSRANSNKSRQVNETPEVLPTVSVYSNTVTPTQSRRFNPSASIRARSVGGKAHQETAASFKTPSVQRSNTYNPSTRQILPTSSTSIYRFKLNRPTGRWRFKPSPKPKVNIIKTKEDEDHQSQQQISSTSITARELPAPVYAPALLTGNDGEIQIIEETRTESNELAQDVEPELVPVTLRVATVTPTEFSDSDKYYEVATIRSPYVFQAGNFKNTRYITLTKTFTKEIIQPTQALVQVETLENILATKAPYEKILEGSSDVATLPVIILGGDMATPPLETVTQMFSTTQLMLKTSILPALYDGVTTLYTLTQSYFVTRVVRAVKTVPPIELFQFVPTKSLTEFNTALQEAGSEHREQLLGSESDDDTETAYQHIVAPPDELISVGSDFDPSSMDEKFPKLLSPKSPKTFTPKAKAAAEAGIPDLSKFTPEQLALLRYFSATGQQPPLPFQQQPQFQQAQFQQQQQQAQFPQQQQLQNPIPQNYYPSPLLPVPQQPQFQVTSSPVIYDTVTTIIESKTLRIQFGVKPTQTTLYSTKVVPTKATSYVTMSVPATAAIPNFFPQGALPLGYVG